MGIKTNIVQTDILSDSAGSGIGVNSPITFNNVAHATTQSPGDNSVNIATTAYVDSRPTITPKGEWNGSGYSVNDSVSYLGSSYLCIQANSGFQPDINPTYWQVLANKGNNGVNGNDGAQGAPGLPMIWRGEWSGGCYVTQTTSQSADGISYQGSSYICIADNCGQTPFEGSSYWQLLARIGSNGSDGTPGVVQSVSGVGSYINQVRDGGSQTNIVIKDARQGNGIAISDESNDLRYDLSIPIYSNNSYQNSIAGITFDSGMSVSFTTLTNPNTGENITVASVTSTGGGISDAPFDGNIYGRQNGNWTTVGGGGSYAGIYNNGSSYGNPSGLNFTGNVSVNYSGYGVDINIGGGGSTTIEVDLDGSNQGTYSAINFLSRVGNSSGNQVYTGNLKPFWLNGSYQFEAMAIDFQNTSISQSTYTNPNTGQNIPVAIVQGLQGPQGNPGNDGAQGPPGSNTINIYEDCSGGWAAGAINFANNIVATQSGCVGTDINVIASGSQGQLQYNNGNSFAGTNLTTDGTNLTMNGGTFSPWLITFTGISTPSAPAVTTANFFAKTDEIFYVQNSAGIEQTVYTTIRPFEQNSDIALSYANYQGIINNSGGNVNYSLPALSNVNGMEFSTSLLSGTTTLIANGSDQIELIGGGSSSTAIITMIGSTFKFIAYYTGSSIIWKMQ